VTEHLSKLVEFITQLYNIIGPAFLAMCLMFGGIGVFTYNMYTFNVERGITDSFPSQFQINLFFYVALITGMLMVIISFYQTIALMKRTQQNIQQNIPYQP
jgi:TRAP-type C4-dicarboxylate transport system permease small subunit